MTITEYVCCHSEKQSCRNWRAVKIPSDFKMMKALICLATLIVSTTNARLFNKVEPFSVPTPSASIATIDAADKCVPAKQCDSNAPWRSIDGSCNNLLFPMWGQAKTALTRLAPAQYQDGVNEPRKAESGNELPNARKIVVEAFSFDEDVDNINTLALMSVGQLISHDTALIGASPDAPQTCCTEGGPTCMNIQVDSNDPFYKQFNVTCLPMTRAPTTASLGCSLKPQYTLTEVSHFIDASFVYGSSEKEAERLREKKSGLLKKSEISGQSYPPHAPNPRTCFNQSPTSFCMDTGDVRANQNPPLGALHILFFREHNRLAHELQAINPTWNDDRLYQEARRILVGEWQIIVYRDYLPYIIGRESAISEKLLPDLELMSDDYDEFLNPSTTNDFTSAAFRVFHSQIPSAYCAKGANDTATGCPFGANNFSNSLDNPGILSTTEGLGSVLLGLDQQNCDKTDEAFTVEVSGKLFRRDKPWGLDLISTDIARGRDTGLPPYNKYRSLCGLSPAKTWRQLLDVLTLQDMRKLRSLYESPDDVDLYVAAVLERKFGNALVGHTFQCLLVDQFKRWMNGDRYFVHFKGFSHSLKPEQVKALGNTSLARIFCDNGDGIMDIPKDIFHLRSDRVACDKIPRVNLSSWKES